MLRTNSVLFFSFLVSWGRKNLATPSTTGDGCTYKGSKEKFQLKTVTNEEEILN
jgi:hypothetical protein